MNRRRTAAGRKRLAPKKRKTPPKKRPTKQRPTAKRQAKKSPAKRAPRKAAARPRAQNRRRLASKKAKPAKAKQSWRERMAAARAGVGAWVTRSRGLLERSGQAAILGLAVVALVWVGDQTVGYARTADAFAIREVVIEGNLRLEAIDVRRAAGLQIGSNIFEVSTESARDRLLQHPWVKEAAVVRKLPNRVRVELVERTPVALVALDQLYLVSEEGVVFKRLGVDDPADLPIVTGIASERFYDDFDYRKAVLLRSMAVLQDYEGAGLSELERVSEIHFEGPTGIELFVGDDGMHVRMGNGQHRNKLRRLRQVLERLAREKARPAYVYLDNVRSPERVTVRLH
ncbi:MAG: FtsQ-type POTRA domain-containing protein [Myxococcales bacterium]|nr:FtsQ-type POTRA domain-containing protein [Myxococcales bacterium]MDH3485957.1 FtsQ-type POTRA domain-containing protein [Myxococcales bacterium]